MSAIPLLGHPGMGAALARYERIGGNQGGILPGMLVSVAAVEGEPYLRSATAAMPQYHRLALDDPHMQMQYHLAGYGSTHEEAVTRLTGEAVERYAAIMAMPLFADRIEYASYRSLSSRHRVLPLELLGVFDAGQQAQLARMMHRYAPEPPGEDDVVAWIACPSLTRPGEEVYLPAQLVFLASAATRARPTNSSPPPSRPGPRPTCPSTRRSSAHSSKPCRSTRSSSTGTPAPRRR